MNRNQFPCTLSAFLIVMAMAACVSSGQAIQPTPGIDSNAIATAVEGTARAAQQTIAVPVQPVATSMTGTTIEKLQDGTTKYSDYDGGFEMTFPVGWLALRPASEEFDTTLKKEGAVNSMLRDQMKLDLAQYDAEVDRLFVYIVRPDIEKKSLFGVANVLLSVSADSFPLDSITMEQLVRNLESAKGPTGFHAETTQTRENNNHVQIIEVGGHYMKDNGKDGTLSAYAIDILFQSSPNSMARMQFRFLNDSKAKLLPDVNSVEESIKIIESSQ